jgi:hypothetical protein
LPYHNTSSFQWTLPYHINGHCHTIILPVFNWGTVSRCNMLIETLWSLFVPSFITHPFQGGLQRQHILHNQKLKL